MKPGDRVKITSVRSRYYELVGSVSDCKGSIVGVYVDRDQIPIDALSHGYYFTYDLCLVPVSKPLSLPLPG